MKRFVVFVVLIVLTTAVGVEEFKLFFGNPHSHTAYSDGTATPEEAYEYGSKVPGLDFLAVTDHGYHFAQTLPEGRDKFAATIEAAKNAATDSFLTFAGFEWTATGTGHINVYGTTDWTDRVKSDLFQLYDWIIERKAVGQFNHPITMFGDNFRQFLYVPQADLYLNLIEVGNGNWRENETISQEMFQAYNLALLKGWHLGATLGQDNHKPNWGGANDSRTAVYAANLTEPELLESFMKRRTYATEDRNLILSFSCDEGFMGEVLHDLDSVTLKIRVEDEPGDELEFVELYSKKGKIARFEVEGASFQADIELEIETGYEYYFLYVKGKDSEEAVSSPIWVEKDVPIKLYNPRIYPASVKPGEMATLSFQISNTSPQATSTTLALSNSLSGIFREVYYLEPYQSKEVSLTHEVGENDGEIFFYLDGILYGNVVPDLRRASSYNVLLDRSHVNFAMERRNSLRALLETAGHKLSTVERFLKPGDFEGIDIFILPLPGVGGTFEKLKLLTPQQRNLILDFVKGGGTLIISGNGEQESEEVLSTYNELLGELSIEAEYTGASSKEISLKGGVVYDGRSNLSGQKGEFTVEKGRVILLEGDPFTDSVIDLNGALLRELFFR